MRGTLKGINLRGSAKVSNVAMTVAVLAILAWFSPWDKPIWLDEAFHFAMGSMSFKEALQTIDYTTIEISHGQTGIYMLLDWVLLKLFGANLFVLRLPSIVAAGILLWAAIVFLKGRGANCFWQLVGIFAIAAIPMFQQYLGEARPFMPLAGSAVAMLAYFSAPLSKRRDLSVVTLGASGLLLGSLFHPYWIYFLALTMAVGYLVRALDGSRPSGLVSFWRFAGGSLTLASLALFVFIGQLTWMRRVRSFDLAPSEIMPDPSAWWAVFIQDHTFKRFPNIWLVLLGFGMVSLILMYRRGIPSSFFGPITLFLLAVCSSLGISAISYSRGYFLYERQWIAGVVLSSLAITWFFVEISKQSVRKLDWISHVPSFIYALFVFFLFIQSSIGQLQLRNDWAAGLSEVAVENRSSADIMASLDDEALVYGANVNAVRGGEVWPEFTDWYWKQAGMRPEFREVNPSWTESVFGR